jgi:hypothetical protein
LKLLTAAIADPADWQNAEPGVVKTWVRQKNTLEYPGLWETLNNPNFKGGKFGYICEMLWEPPPDSDSPVKNFFASIGFG